MKSVFTGTILRNLLSAGLVCTALALGANAQVQTQTEVSNGPSYQSVNVRRGTVVYVSGNDVVIKGDDGRIRDFPNVPDDVRVNVGGQQLSVYDLQPGMTIERTTVTTATPGVITTIKSVTGTVWHVNPPLSVILTLENGKNQEFKIPRGTKFTVDGQPTDAFALQPGMKVTATAVTEVPEEIVTKEITRTGEMPEVDPNIALLVVVVPYDDSANTTAADPQPAADPAPTPAPADPAPAELPKTASYWPLVGLLSGLFFVLGFGLKARRAFSS